MNFLSSHPSVGGTVGWDGLQLQARTSQPLGRDDVCTAAHWFYVPALQQVAARNTSRVRHPRGTTGVRALIHNRAGYGKGTDGGTKTIGGVRQSGIAPHKKSIGSLIKAHFQYNAINTIIIFIIIFSNLFYVMIDVNSSSNVKSLPKISSTEGAKMENVWKCPKV